ncbi:unnamed protein product [Umbelopsis ramanniana]
MANKELIIHTLNGMRSAIASVWKVLHPLETSLAEHGQQRQQRDLIPEELLHYKFPRDYIPGTDRISKIVAKNQFTIDLITTSLLNVPAGTYTTGDSMCIDGTECDILYLLRSADFVNLSPSVVEIQHTMTREFMCRAVQYCLNVYKRFHIFPILFVVCISKTE